jgi:hypothetical protein
MDQPKTTGNNKKPAIGFAKLAILAGKSMKSKAQWEDKVRSDIILRFLKKHCFYN